MSMGSRARTRPAAPPAPAAGRPRAGGGTGARPRVSSGAASGTGRGTRHAAAGRRQPSRARPRARLTGRGAVLVMLAVFLVGDLIGVGLHTTVVAGLGYAAGCALAVTYARREAMLVVVTTPPAVFLAALVAAELMTAGGSALLSTAEGTLLTLAGTAPWLLVVTLACVGVAMTRGLRSCVQELRTALAGQAAARG
jgi:hypothetical protein